MFILQKFRSYLTNVAKFEAIHHICQMFSKSQTDLAVVCIYRNIEHSNW